MSEVAKKMLERYGWKEGEGLGKDKSGMKTYVKVAKRGTAAAAGGSKISHAIGLGHQADPSTSSSMINNNSTNNKLHNMTQQAVELDSMYDELRKKTKTHTSRKHVREDDDSDTEEPKRKKQKRHSSDEEDVNNTYNSSSNSESDASDVDDEKAEDTTAVTSKKKMLSDAELFQKCGGVRLGRTGRHRFFTGKLSRIEESHKKASSQ